MNDIFDYELAKKHMQNHLLQKRSEYEDEPVLYAKRIKGINKVLADEELLETFVNMQLMGDMVLVLNDFSALRSNKKSAYINTNGLLSSSVKEGITIFSCGRVKIGGEDQVFADSEEFRKYLYGSVGFTFESHEQALDNLRAGKRVIDPVALSFDSDYDESQNGTYRGVPTIYRMLDYMDTVDKLPVPQRTSGKQYTK